ncbi:MAG: PHP domain-containing protein [Clostridiales bacterium]|jgi:histidinol phosphatase-like PHP family hydrolase|nr:PHP domain-containing protein [Clostridiales bacterium]
MFLNQDLHVHTNLSLCAKSDATVDAYLALCKDEGITTIGFSDHFWDPNVPGASDWYAKQDFTHINVLRTRIPKDTHGVQVRFGCETEYCGHGKLGISRETARLLDFVLVPTSHTHMKGFTVPFDLHTPEQYRRIMLDRTYEVVHMGIATGIAHPFVPLGCTCIEETLHGITDSDYRKVCEAAAKNGVAMEINPDIFNHKCADDADGQPGEYRRFFTIARECGCKFFAGCDAHTPKSFLCHDRIREFARICGITEDNIFILA